jgi:dihydrolipoamide dehydrogenase
MDPRVRLGSEVTVIELQPRVVPLKDAEISEALATYLRDEGIDVHLETRIVSASGGPGCYRIEIERGGACDIAPGQKQLDRSVEILRGLIV